MQYPLISEYIEAILSSEDNLDKLSDLRPILDESDNPIMSSGNFAVVFKMTDGMKNYAIKCFTREQEGRAEAYRQICEELEYVSSTFLCTIKYYDKELFVDSNSTSETEFPVLLMDWVEGVPLDRFVSNHLNDQYTIGLLCYQFSRMAQWLMTQPFAHGDLKPDNILVQADGSMVLVDYDGMFVPAMQGQKARELGSPNYQHPLRTDNDFDEHIDDFSLSCILLSLKSIAIRPSLFNDYGTTDSLLFSEKDYRSLSESKVFYELTKLLSDLELALLYSLFVLVYSKKNFIDVSFNIFKLKRPLEPKTGDDTFIAEMEAERRIQSQYEEDYQNYIERRLAELNKKEWPLLEFARQYGKMAVGDFCDKETGYIFKACRFTKPDGTRIYVNFSSELGELTPKEIASRKNDLIVVRFASGNYCLYQEDKQNDDSVEQDTLDKLFEQIKLCARKISTCLEKSVTTDLDKKLSLNELTILSAASISQKQFKKYRTLIEKRIIDDYLSINEIGGFDFWCESNTAGMYLDNNYTTPHATPLFEFEKKYGEVTFHTGTINAYPYDDGFWGEFVGENGEKQRIYADQGFHYYYSISDLLNNKKDFGIIEEKNNNISHDNKVYCLKRIVKEHAILISYINERLSFYNEIFVKIENNQQRAKEYAFLLYNAVINEKCNCYIPDLVIKDLDFREDFVIDGLGDYHRYSDFSLKPFLKHIWKCLMDLWQEDK